MQTVLEATNFSEKQRETATLRQSWEAALHKSAS
jgi:hypothetical protein